MPLPPLDPLAAVVAVRAADLGGLDRLAVDAAGTGRRLPTRFAADLHPQGIVEGPPGPVGGPADEVVIDGPPAREVVRQGPPGAAVAVTVEDRIKDVPEVGLAGPPQVRGGREQRLEDVPLGIGQVTRIGFGSHLLSTYESALWNRLLVGNMG